MTTRGPHNAVHLKNGVRLSVTRHPDGTATLVAQTDTATIECPLDLERAHWLIESLRLPV